MRRRILALLAVASVLATLAVIQPASPAGATPWGASWSGDYATEEWGDPWDFSNDLDWDVQARYESPGVVNGNVSGGTLNFDVAGNAGGVLIGSAHYGDEALQWGRSTWLKPIDGSTYPTLTFRLYVPPGTNVPAGGVSWFTCGGTVGSCANNLSFHPAEGWNTYSFNPGWAGQRIYSILIVPTAFTGAGFKLDWVRVTRAGGQTDAPAPGAEPIPVVMNPDRIGGTDYATAVNGNAWDFNDGSDVAAFEHLDSVSFANGALNACNTNNDPAVVLPLAAPFDGTQYHRLRFNVRYDGGFSLANAPGGGMNARVMWTVAGVPGWQVSEDIVVYPGWNDVDLDMFTWPLGAVNEKDLGAGAGWIGRTITGLRIDPHEDPGRRCFSLDDVRLQADDATGATGFPIVFRDDSTGTGATVPGTTAEIYLDSTLGSYSGALVASGIAVQSGTNTFNWSGAGVPNGTYWVRVRLTNPSGRTSEAYSSGPLQVTGKPPVPARTVTPVDTGAGGATAVLTNLTMTDAPGTGYVTAARCENLSGNAAPATSNGNFQIQQSRANLSVVPVDGNGRFCIWNESAVHLLSDVQGRFDPTGQLAFTPSGPARVLDTRQTSKPAAGSITEVRTGAPSGAAAVLVNLTSTNSTAGAFITADRCSAFNGEPSTSNGNMIPGRDVANLSVVPVENGRFCIYSKAATDLVVDMQGYFSSGGSQQLTILSAASRVMDTRQHFAMPGRNEIIQVSTGLPASASAALVNLTMVDAPGGGYITAGRCSSMSPGFQPFSNGNFVARQAIANLSVVPLENGRFCIYTENPTQLIVDVQGQFSPNGALRFTLQSPARVLDTRSY